MELLLYGALLLSQAGTSAKQYAMKKCGAVAPGPFNSICINLARSVICLVVSLFIWLIADKTGTTALGVAISLIAGLGTALSLFSWILCAQRLSITLIEGVSMVGTLIIPLFLAPYLYGGETVTPLQWIGTALVFISIFLFTNKAPKGTKSTERKGVTFSILMLLLCASSSMLAFIGKKLYVYHITNNGLGSIQTYTLLNFCSVLGLFLLLFALYYQRQKRAAMANAPTGARVRVELPYRRIWVYILIAACALYIYELFATYAAYLPSAIYYPLSRAIAILGSFLLDVIVFKDKITQKKLLGLVLLIVAVVLTNL